MSTDFLEVDHDANDATVLLEMKVSGDAFLTVLNETKCSNYHLPPNENGWQNAESIIQALQNWITFTKKVHAG